MIEEKFKKRLRLLRVIEWGEVGSNSTFLFQLVNEKHSIKPYHSSNYSRSHIGIEYACCPCWKGNDRF